MVGSSGHEKTPPIIALLAGGIAGGVESAVSYPAELCKTRAQLYGSAVSKNPIVVIKTVIREEGVKALYKGCSTLIVGSIAKDATRFLAFDTIRGAFEDPEAHTLTPLRSLLAGMAAGVVASIVAVTPSERIKTALIDDVRHGNRFTSPLHCIRTLIAERGLRALYAGFVTTTLKQVGTTGARLGSYNIIKDYQHKAGIEQTIAMNFVNGAVAGTLTTFATQPFDTIKTKAQSINGAGTMESLREVLSKDGVRGLWRGTVMRLSRTVLAGGVLFVTNEQATKVLKAIMGKPINQ